MKCQLKDHLMLKKLVVVDGLDIDKLKVSQLK